MLNLRGLSRGQVLMVLFNASRPQGMGFLQYDPKPMTEQEAEELVAKHKYFDYLQGRVMKLSFAGEEIDPFLYDRDNGQGAAQRAIDAYANNNVKAIEDAHARGVLEAAGAALELMQTPATIKAGAIVMTLNDVKPELAPKVEQAVKDTVNPAQP